MEAKKQILIRTYLVFIGMLLFCLAIVGKVMYIQMAEGNYWRSMADSSHIRYEVIEAERGTIYSEAGEVLSTSVPEFDIYVDFQADGLIEKEGLLFYKNIDSLSLGLAALFGDKGSRDYRKILEKGFREKSRFTLLKRKISFAQYEDMKQLPLIKMGRNKSGFIAVVRMKRLYPFKLMANRTIGIARENNKVGLEKQYDKWLMGTPGKRLVRYIAGGAGVPLEGSEIDPRDGCDVVTTLDVNMQDVAQEALARMMVQNEALRGTCIVLETKTGKVRAIANLGKQEDGSYYEDYNYAVTASEPGSTWKLLTLMSALDDKKLTLNTTVNLEGGAWQVGGQTVFDSERHGMHEATVQQAFEKSSNVGMAKIAYQFYGNQPSRFIEHIVHAGMDSVTGIDLPGESKPRIYRPGTKHWSKTTLPWMGFGYNLTVTPMHTAMLYNAMANNGKMMKPYLVNALIKDGKIVKQFEPTVLNAQLCKPETVQALRTCMEGVVLRGTAHALLTDQYDFAGKTGTSLVADKGISYGDKMYQSSFAGYFPANDPQFTIVVVIRNRAHAPRFYGGVVAGPVFREVADRLYANHLTHNLKETALPTDSTAYAITARKKTMQSIADVLGWKLSDSAANALIAACNIVPDVNPVLHGNSNIASVMPELTGVGLKDAVAMCEEKGLAVTIQGKGKVQQQSIAAGQLISKGQLVALQLN